MSVSLMVHAGGRWRAVPSGRGAVCVARRGQLFALRHLRADNLTLGPALPYKYRKPQPASSESDISAEPSRTKHKSRQHANTQKASVAVQCGAGRVSSPRGESLRRGSKRRRSSSSEALPPQPRTLTTLATLHADIHQEPKRPKIEALHLKRKRRSTSSDDLPLKASPKRSLILKRKLGPLKRTSPSKKHSPILPSGEISNRTNKLNRIPQNQQEQHKKILKCKNATSSYEITSQQRNQQIMSLVISTDESDFETVKIRKQKSKSCFSDKAVKHKLGTNKTQDRSSTDQPIKLAPTRAIDKSVTDEETTLRHNKATVASINEPVKRKLQPKRTINHSRKEQALISPKKSIDRSSTDEPVVHKKLPTRATYRTTEDPDPKKVIESHNSTTSRESQNSYRELVIDERDVEIIRLYLQKHYPDEELLRFDTDDEYKTMYFYQINPLVSVERCPRIASMIRSASQRRLLQFASKLGLRSVSEVSPTKRYRTRRRERMNNVLDSSDAEDKENIDKPAPTTRTVESGKVLRESLNKGLNRARVIKENENDGTMDTVEFSSANESDHEKDAERKKEKQPQSRKPKVMKPRVISSKRAGCKEYSNLEDHAIVAWVSTGARASSVNGNRLWRQLQEQYPRLTGHGRTWHSLRNRYLRYILPRLAALALPHAQQARLRAAAATGELKARKKESRRNSMFPLPARGASSRHPRPFAVPSHADHDGEPPKDDADGERSPRYSALTRQFARAQDERRPPSERSAEQPTDRSAASEPSRTKRSSLTSTRNNDTTAPDVERSPRYSALTRQFARAQAEGQPTERSAASEPSRTKRSSLTSTRNNDTNNIRKSKRTSPNRRNSPHSPNQRTRDRQSPSPRRPSRRRSSDSIRNNSRRSTRRKSSESTTGDDESEESSERHSPRHTTTRRNSSQDQNRRKSNRRNSPIETHRRRSNRQNSPPETNRRRSSRRISPPETNRRRSNRHNSPSESNRPTSKKHEARESNRRISPIETNGRKKNRLLESSSDSSAFRGDPMATRRRTLVQTTDISPSRPLTNNNKHTKDTTTSQSRHPRLRKLFNHKAVF